MTPEVKRIDKRMEAETVSLLKHMLEMELRRTREENDLDIILFIGVDGRIFSSYIPPSLNPKQYHLLSLVKSNLEHICSQLTRENLKISIQQYAAGTVIITGIGASAFLVFLTTKDLDISNVSGLLANLQRSGIVLKHLFDLKPITSDAMSMYPDDVVEELRKLSRLLFVEKFEETREYRRNMEIMKLMKERIGSVLGVGSVDEAVTFALNELGVRPAYMTDSDWLKFVEKVVEDHIRPQRGDMVADKCLKSWREEVEKKLKSFV